MTSRVTAAVNVSTADLLELAADVRGAANALHDVIADSINREAESTRKESVREVTSYLNVQQSYVERKLSVSKEATARSLSAIVEIPDEGIGLSNFSPRQNVRSNDWTAEKFADKFGSTEARKAIKNKRGKTFIAPWIERTGDQRRGIAKGQKQSGLTVRIMRARGAGSYGDMFQMPILSGKVMAGRFGVFARRNKGDRIKMKYALSPSQMLKGVWRRTGPKIAERLAESVLDDVASRFGKGVLKK